MFGMKNTAVQIKLVKDKESSMKKQQPVDDVVAVDPKQITDLATDFAVKTIGAVGVAIGGYKVLSTICDIAVIAAKAKFK